MRVRVNGKSRVMSRLVESEKSPFYVFNDAY
jgi:hypothetical protein